VEDEREEGGLPTSRLGSVERMRTTMLGRTEEADTVLESESESESESEPSSSSSSLSNDERGVFPPRFSCFLPRVPDLGGLSSSSLASLSLSNTSSLSPANCLNIPA
jgi:hypothetical protein